VATWGIMGLMRGSRVRASHAGKESSHIPKDLREREGKGGGIRLLLVEGCLEGLLAGLVSLTGTRMNAGWP